MSHPAEYVEPLSGTKIRNEYPPAVSFIYKAPMNEKSIILRLLTRESYYNLNNSFHNRCESVFYFRDHEPEFERFCEGVLEFNNSPLSYFIALYIGENVYGQWLAIAVCLICGKVSVIRVSEYSHAEESDIRGHIELFHSGRLPQGLFSCDMLFVFYTDETREIKREKPLPESAIGICSFCGREYISPTTHIQLAHFENCQYLKHLIKTTQIHLPDPWQACIPDKD